MNGISSKWDKKAAAAFRTIGEVAEYLAVEPHVLRFWESKFPQIQPQKRRGRRYYRPEDVHILSQIKYLLYEQGYTIKGAQQFLEESDMNTDSASGQADLFSKSVQDISSEKGLEMSSKQQTARNEVLREVLKALCEARDSLAKVIAG